MCYISRITGCRKMWCFLPPLYRNVTTVLLVQLNNSSLKKTTISRLDILWFSTGPWFGFAAYLGCSMHFKKAEIRPLKEKSITHTHTATSHSFVKVVADHFSQLLTNCFSQEVKNCCDGFTSCKKIVC